MAQGTIKWFHAIMRYGIIVPDDGGAGVLLRLSAAEIAGLGALQKGDRLEYDTVRTPGDQPLAANLRSVAPSPRSEDRHGG